MATSNSYVFGTNTQIDDLLRESYERIGVIGNEVTGYQVQSFIMSANLELTKWMGMGPNSWMRKRLMFSLYQAQPIYQLPINITQVVDVVATIPTQLNIGGTPYSSGIASGSVANVFNPNILTGCTLDDPNGWIAYDYGNGNSNSILYVGVIPLSNNSTYTLDVQYSFDDVPTATGNNTWRTAYQSGSQVYNAQQMTWFVIENALNARSWRILETGGATLSISQLVFAQPNTAGMGDRYLTALSYTDWMQIASKMTQSYPSSYFFNTQIQPTLTLWPVPNQSYTALLYTAYMYPQDVTNLFNQFDLPQRFYDALVSGIAYRLAGKVIGADPNLLQRLRAERDESFASATKTDETNVTLRFNPDFSPFTA